MAGFTAPTRDIHFVLHEVLGVEAAFSALPGFEECTAELIDQVVDGAAKLAESVLFPLNQSGDKDGCRLEDGEVRTPPGFREAYQRLAAGGWTGLVADPVYGGQGLPKVVNAVFEELLSAANLSFSTYPGLSHGAYNALALHGSEALKAQFLPRLAAGTWAGTMCLTEPQCGTDLGLVRTRAEPDGQGAYRISGSKIFITAGDHDLTENILHLVLARLPDAPPGVKGISLFLVPKWVPTATGDLGPRNAVVCTAIEHKMGIKASSTCSLSFDGATGWLVGAPHKGLRAMFTMMNAARLSVGIQGLGIAEVATQNARTYARERLQGRALGKPRYPHLPADPLIVHPDVRRMLLTMRAYTEGARAVAYAVGLALDRHERHPDAAVREEAGDYVAVMTPVVKALFTDLGFETANLAVQIYGGHGYVWDNGIEQLVRDARITQIYEGANGIQALDLVGRKLSQDGGRLLRRFFHPAANALERAAEDGVAADLVEPLSKAFKRLQQITLLIATRGIADPQEGAAAASDYLRLFGLVALGLAWLGMAKAAVAGLGGEDDTFYETKLQIGRFYMARILPQVHGLAGAVASGAGPIMGVPDDAL